MQGFLARGIPRQEADKASQLLLSIKYRELAQSGGQLPVFRDVGFRCHSQTDEDGILLFIFALIGAESRTAVEICAGTGVECNSANLIVNHGWHALLVDGESRNTEIARRFYSTNPDTLIVPPSIRHAWVDRDNVDDLISSSGFSGSIDLLSIDVDGNDYWIWEAITVVIPRVVVIECQPMWGGDLSVTVPYDPAFTMSAERPGYHGASLPALVKLGGRLGYRLVGSNRFGFNAFFIRHDLAVEMLPEVTAESCIDQPYLAEPRRKRLEKVRHFPWVDV